jgi:LacI family transcriptional regulator
MKATTLKEIAEKLGISITTVSKALKDYTDVSAATKKAVQDAAAELNYTPNNFALYLKTNESKTVGLVIPEVVHHFFSNIINGIIDEAEKFGYLVFILQSNENIALEKKQIELLVNKRVDGIMISLSNDSNNEEHLKELLRKEIPLVQFDKISKLINSSKVIINDRKAAFEAVQHLIDQGCRKIAHIRGPLNPQNAIDRFLGYKKALEENHIEFDPNLVYTCEKVNFDEGRAFAKEIMETHPDVDGIFAITDLVAVGVLNYLQEVKIEVPQKVKLIGFSNWFMSEIMSPKLSTVDQPGFEMGVESFRLLLEEINAKKQQKKFIPKIVELKTSVIHRESTK